MSKASVIKHTERDNQRWEHVRACIPDVDTVCSNYRTFFVGDPVRDIFFDLTSLEKHPLKKSYPPELEPVAVLIKTNRHQWEHAKNHAKKDILFAGILASRIATRLINRFDCPVKSKKLEQYLEDYQSIATKHPDLSYVAKKSSTEVKVMSYIAQLTNQTLRQLSVSDIQVLSNLVTDNTYSIVDYLGWAKELVWGVARQNTRRIISTVPTLTGPSELDFERMLPEELVNMTTDPYDVDWLIRACDDAIIHRQYDSKVAMGDGPFIVIRDESSSMWGMDVSGMNIAISKAIELALMDVVISRKRRFVSIPFSSQSYVWTYDAKKIVRPFSHVEYVTHHITQFLNQDTMVLKPLERAFDIIESEKLSADILLITDGDFYESEKELSKFVQMKQDTNTKIVTVLLNYHKSNHHKSRIFSDVVIPINDLLANKDEFKNAIKHLL